MAECKHRSKRSWKPVFKKREFVAFCSTCGAATGGRKKMSAGSMYHKAC